MIRHLAVAAAGLFSSIVGDFHHIRFSICVLGSGGVAALVYLLALPTELPLWPAFVFVGLAGLIGLVWEDRANERLGVSGETGGRFGSGGTLSANGDRQKQNR